MQGLRNGFHSIAKRAMINFFYANRILTIDYISKKANPAAIGIFLVGAIVLAVVAILMFGSGKFFSKTEPFILYCEGSVNGLDIGAPVKFKGVNIGQVSRMYIRHNQIDESINIPVIVEIDTTRLQETLGINTNLSDPDKFHEQVSFGLRARLRQASFVTGLLYIELDYYPNAGPPRFIQVPDNLLYLEIPTISSEFTEVFETFASALNSVSQFNFARIGTQIETILNEAASGFKEIQFSAISHELLGVLENAQVLLSNPEINEIITTLNTTINDGRNTIQRLDSKIDPLMLEVEKTTAQVRDTLATFQQVGSSVDTILQPNSVLMLQLEETLQELSNMVRSIRLFSEFIEQNPNAFLTGKQETK